MGGNIGKFIQLLITFLDGVTVAFVQGWILTLIMLATIPLPVPGQPPLQQLLLCP
jgi:ATP-binding cassette, subfamily B (MDR/TAP), member 1